MVVVFSDLRVGRRGGISAAWRVISDHPYLHIERSDEEKRPWYFDYHSGFSQFFFNE